MRIRPSSKGIPLSSLKPSAAEFALSGTLMTASAVTEPAIIPVPQSLERREGGFTLLVRHARTDRSIPTRETPGYSPPLRSEQRNLTAAGERDVRLMAEVVSKYALPIGEVLSSPIYRCRETADAFGTPTVTMALRVFPTTAETAALVGARGASAGSIVDGREKRNDDQLIQGPSGMEGGD